MSTYFDDIETPKIVVGTQTIIVDPATGSTYVVGSGPVGPRGFSGDGAGPGGTSDHGALTGLADDDHTQYHNNARGDARYALINHAHPEYADFRYSIAFNGDVANLGGSYTVDGSSNPLPSDTIYMPALAGQPVPEGQTITFLLRGHPSDTSFDRGYVYTKATSPDPDTWIWERYDDPFQFDNVTKIISVNFDFNDNDALLGLIQFTGSYSIKKVAWYTAGAGGGDPQVDVRESAQEFLRNDWESRTHPLMVTNQTAALVTGGYDATWAITRATARGTLPHTPAGLDIQWFGKVLAPYTQPELTAAGVAPLAEPHASMYQKFYELITLTRPSIFNDWFEWARYFTPLEQPQGLGRSTYFYENTIIGGVAEDPTNGVKDTGVEVGQPERARMTLDTDNRSLQFYNWMPYDNNDPTLVKCPRGLWWKPVFELVDDAFGSMANPETEVVPPSPALGFTAGQPEVMTPWRLGIQSRIEIAEFVVYEFGQTTPILNIDEAALTAAGINATSFVDSTGVNTISTVAATTIPGPATFPAHNHDGTYSLAAHDHDGTYSPTAHDHDGVYSPTGHDHSGVYSPVAHNHDGTYSPAAHNHDATYAPMSHGHNGEDIIFGTIGAERLPDLSSTYVPVASPLLLPDPAALPDGKVAKVAGGLWVPGDDESGGSTIPSNPTPRLSGATERGWVVPGVVMQSSGATILTINRPVFQMMRLLAPMVFDRIGIEVTQLAAEGGTSRIAIYAADEYWQPTGNPLVDTGNLVTDTGSVPVQVEAVINLTLQPGNYVGILVSGGITSPTAQLRFVSGIPPVAPIMSGASPFRQFNTLASHPAITSAGFPSPAVSLVWDRDLLGTAPQNYYFKLREVA